MKKLILLILSLNLNFSISQELIIGEETVQPGIVFIFEGAVKDHVMPSGMHLKENETNVHIEARVNWDFKNTPEGSPKGGFVAYLHITSKVTNQKTGLSTFIDLIPHINLIDNYHYARNISLPGKKDELYTVEFNVIPPTNIELSLHKDWLNKYGNQLMTDKYFLYENVNFEEIVNASRK
ncbi:MAG: hypothetical protein CMQ66_03720 [Gammaproteobacteria bacterium]|nr:hypothetical protein [Gammaproteobacteria bacterium]|tara:strand:+ start:1758 stop:2297 length:540 start_codon:yes stop_codon:yes gene_type:complete